MNSILGPSAAGISCILMRKVISSSKKEVKNVKWDHIAISNGVLCGLVAVTGNCAFTTDWGAIAIGGISPIFYALGSRLMGRLKIDDPYEAASIHGICGAWGVMATAFLDLNNGVFYGGNAKIIGIQLLGIVAIIGWDVICMLIILFPLKYFAKDLRYNFFRVTAAEEDIGIDFYNHALISPAIE